MNGNFYQNNGQMGYNNGYNNIYNNGYPVNNKVLRSIRNSESLKKIYSTAALGLCIFFAVMLFSQIVIMSATMFVDMSVANEGWFNLFLSDVPIYGIALWCLLFFFSKLKVQKIEKKKLGVGNSISFFFIACFMMIAGSIIGQLADAFLQSVFDVETNDALTETANSMSLPIQIIFFVIIAPIGEEFVFRKLLLDRTAKYGEGAAILFSGLTFSLFHGNIMQIFYAFGAGILLAYIYVKTGSYIRCVLLHGIINALFGVVAPAFFKYIDSGNQTMEAVATIAVCAEYLFALVGLILFIVYLCKKKIKIEKSEYTLSDSAVSCAFSNAPFIIFAVVTGLLVLMNYSLK